MTRDEVLLQLQALGTEQTRKTHARHGAPENMYGVKIGDMKPLVKTIKKDYQLAKDLYATGNSDAMYFAGLIADDAAMTKKDLQAWADQATWPMIGDTTVAWVAAGSPHGWEMALRWIDSKKVSVACSGWCTLSGIVALKDDADLDLPALQKLLDRVAKTVHSQPDRVRYVMNSFVIALGSYVEPLHAKAMVAATAIGPVTCDMGDTACKVPDASAYLAKMKAHGLGKKRKTVKC